MGDTELQAKFHIKPPNEIDFRPIVINIFNTWNKTLYSGRNFKMKEDILDTWIEKKADLSRYLVFLEEGEDRIAGFVCLSNYSGRSKSWEMIYATLPDYINTSLPQQLITTGISLGKALNLSKLMVSVIGTLSAPYDRALEQIGCSPIQYGHEMHLSKFDQPYIPKIPEKINFRLQSDPDDYEEFVSMINETFRGSFHYTEMKADDYREMHEIKKKHGEIDHWLAYDNSRLIGYCNMMISPDKVSSYIHGLGVLPEYQQRGIGNHLLALGIQNLKQKGAGLVVLNAYVDNHNAVGLYLRHGFHSVENLRISIYEVNLQT